MGWGQSNLFPTLFFLFSNLRDSNSFHFVELFNFFFCSFYWTSYNRVQLGSTGFHSKYPPTFFSFKSLKSWKFKSIFEEYFISSFYQWTSSFIQLRWLFIFHRVKGYPKFPFFPYLHNTWKRSWSILRCNSYLFFF